MANKAVFLDRDGTLNEDPGYLNDPRALKLLPGVPEALRSLSDKGYLLIVVSNQSGIARGLLSLEQLNAIHMRMDEILRNSGVQIHAYQCCTHHPDEDCACRKPKPFLLLEASQKYDIDLSKSYMIGDKKSDIECGKNAGCLRTILVLTGNGSNELSSCRPDFVAKDLLEASEWVGKSYKFKG